MVDLGQADAGKALVGAERQEIDIVDRMVAIAVDEIDQAAADAFDGRDTQFHRPDLAVHRLGAQ